MVVSVRIDEGVWVSLPDTYETDDNGNLTVTYVPEGSGIYEFAVTGVESGCSSISNEVAVSAAEVVPEPTGPPVTNEPTDEPNTDEPADSPNTDDSDDPTDDPSNDDSDETDTGEESNTDDEDLPQTGANIALIGMSAFVTIVGATKRRKEQE